MSNRVDLIHMSLEELAHRLGGDVSGNQVLAPGPGHRPEDRSLCVKVNRDGTWAAYSHSGDNIFTCKDHVREKAGLPAWNGRSVATPYSKANGPDRTVVAQYDYTDEDGNLLFQVVRYAPKKFVQRRPDGNGGWCWKLGNVPRMLYRLPALLEAVANDHPLFLVEGEKSADALAKLGIPATCSPHGAGKWRDQYARFLKDAKVIILPDNDEPEQHHAEMVRKSLTGVAASVKVLALPGLREGEDVFDWIEAGGTAEKLWGLVEPDKANGPDPGADAAAKPDPCFTLFDDIESSPGKRWRVQDFMGEGEINCTFGPPSSGKSVIVGDRNAHIAAGMPWFGRRVEQCAVLHVAAERAALVKRRYAAFKKHHEVSGLALGLVNRRVDLCTNDKDAKLLLDYCKRLEDAKGLKVGLIAIETVNRVLAGGDENSPKDMGALVDRLSFLQEETGANINAVHHIPADGTQRLRGHGALLGAVDMTDRVEKIGKLRACTVDKANDGPEGERVVFDLLSVRLHYDEETEIWTTAPVVTPHEGDIPKTTPGQKQRPTDKQRLAVEALRSLVAEGGEKPPPDYKLPAQVLVIPTGRWRDELYRRGVMDSEARNPRVDFRRLKEQLKARGRIAERDTFVWSI